jgi:hypothetical protein
MSGVRRAQLDVGVDLNPRRPDSSYAKSMDPAYKVPCVRFGAEDK